MQGQRGCSSFPRRSRGRGRFLRTLGALAAIAGAVLFSTAPAYAVTVSGVEVGPLDPGAGDTAWEAGQPVLPDAVAQGAAAAPPPGVADAGAHPSAPVRCTVTARSDALPPVKPGDVVCLSGSPAAPLVIKTGGTAALPIIYAGRGAATVRGIDVEASNVVVEGFTSDHGNSMGAKLVGDHIVFQDNTITHPVYTGDDSDGVRFF